MTEYSRASSQTPCGRKPWEVVQCGRSLATVCSLFLLSCPEVLSSSDPFIHKSLYCARLTAWCPICLSRYLTIYLATSYFWRKRIDPLWRCTCISSVGIKYRLCWSLILCWYIKLRYSCDIIQENRVWRTSYGYRNFPCGRNLDGGKRHGTI